MKKSINICMISILFVLMMVGCGRNNTADSLETVDNVAVDIPEAEENVSEEFDEQVMPTPVITIEAKANDELQVDESKEDDALEKTQLTPQPKATEIKDNKEQKATEKKSESQPQPEVKSDSQSQPEVKPESQPQPEVQPDNQPQPEQEPQTNPESNPTLPDLNPICDGDECTEPALP